MTPIRVEIFYTGTVQGVGFRYTVRRIAGQLDVTGFVRNLRDGRVQLVVEGLQTEIDRLLEAVNDTFGGYIHHQEKQQLMASGEFASFDIRF